MWEKQLQILIGDTNDSELFQDFLITYEAETNDPSLRDVSLEMLVFVIYPTLDTFIYSMYKRLYNSCSKSFNSNKNFSNADTLRHTDIYSSKSRAFNNNYRYYSKSNYKTYSKSNSLYCSISRKRQFDY